MRRTVARIVATVIVTGAALTGAGGPAHASLLLYAEPDYRAWIGSFSSAMSSAHNMSANANDTLTSFKNQTSFSVAFWHDANRGGRCWSAAPGDVNRDLGWWDDNTTSSFQLGRSC